MLNSSLSCARDLPILLEGGLKDPWSIHFDESHGRLFVGECGGKRVLVIENVVNIDPLS
jgi:hypothetical protein